MKQHLKTKNIVVTAVLCLLGMGSALAQIPGREMLHGDVCMIVGDTEVIDAHDVRMIETGDDLVFL